MSTETSPLLPSPIIISLWGTNESQTFERASDVVQWGILQFDAWSDVKPTNHALDQAWKNQRSYVNAAQQTAMQLETLLRQPEEERSDQDRHNIQQMEASLRKRLNGFSTGDAITTAHPHFATIQAIAETDPNAGATLLIACLVNGNNHVSSAGQLDAIARIGVTPFHDASKRRAIKSLKAELTTLKKSAETDISTLRATIDEHAKSTKENLKEHQDAITERNTEWDNLKERCDSEWETLKRVLHTELALQAPTKYWRTRSTVHIKEAKKYAIAFGLTLAVALTLFSFLAIGHLLSPGTQSVVLAITPVLVPAFAGVWVLRILGRLLSENLAIAQDARERETMVETFLALMQGETAGKSVVTDDDRRLILHALFRPSAVTATDDSPPLHWIESLRSSKPN